MVMDAASTPWRSRQSRAPASRRSVMKSLKRLAAMAMRRPSPRSCPSYVVIGYRRQSCRLRRRSVPNDRCRASLDTARSFEVLQQMAHAHLLGAQIGDVLGIGGGLERHSFDDLEAEPFEAAVLGRVVGEQAHGGDAEIDQDLGADAV